MPRPDVDIVIPFFGTPEALEGLLEAVADILLEDGDSLAIVDNRPDARGMARGRHRILAAPDVQSSYYARNRGAGAGSAEWVLFLDADVVPSGDLLERYFDPPPAARTAVLAGGVIDEPVTDGRRSVAAAYAQERQHMSQRNTLLPGRWGYAQTANCLVRRSAFEAADGFVADVRSGGDADLCFRLAAAGWEIEERPEAEVIHRARRSLRALLAQRARHGAGAAWLNRRHPGSFPRRRWAGLAVWSVRTGGAALIAFARGGRPQALHPVVEVLSIWAFELGRLTSNEARGERRKGFRR